MPLLNGHSASKGTTACAYGEVPHGHVKCVCTYVHVCTCVCVVAVTSY